MASTSFTAESGRSEFLQLFTTTLKNQDPLDPTKQEDFLLQLAQFSMVEGIETQNTKLDKLIELQSSPPEEPATALAIGDTAWLGKKVGWQDPEGNSYSGIVSGVIQRSGSVMVTVNGESVPVKDINTISEVPSSSQNNFDDLSVASSLLGRTVQIRGGVSGVVDTVARFGESVRMSIAVPNQTEHIAASLADITGVLN
ncbi:MAG: hypothetical protein KDA91_09015 [Planctomycetaceae bacterium]|nr:hypothetical protein [Planctomycetaceae bacterium]